MNLITDRKSHINRIARIVLAMKYKNNRAPNDRQFDCETWIVHWKKSNNSRTTPVCSVYHCDNKSTRAGRIVKCSGTDRTIYITPQCGEHNSRYFTESYSIKKDKEELIVRLDDKTSCISKKNKDS